MTTPIENRRTPHHFRRFTLFAVAILTIAAGGYAVFWRYHLKRFQVVAPGTFYRVAQPTEFGLEHLVRYHGIRTVVSLQLFDSRLHRGWYDFDKPDGAKESEFVRSLGANAVNWPMGDEACWPWPHAWELEEFFHLLDNPANRPVLIHCMGGRHRTGTFSALYRMEYDRWSGDEAIAEMRSFSFGEKVVVQEANLRTYCPRPLPDDASWPNFAAAFDVSSDSKPAEIVPVVADRIRKAGADDELRRKFNVYVASGDRYALPFAARVIDGVDDPVLPIVIAAARTALGDSNTAPPLAEAAATLIADFGSPADQAVLLDALKQESKTSTPSAFYEGLVRGVTNRYTSNRLSFLRPLLDDKRERIGIGAGYTYSATAICRAAAISDAMPALEWTDKDLRAGAAAVVIAWYEKTPDVLKLAQLTPPAGRRTVQSGDGPIEEDLSKLRR